MHLCSMHLLSVQIKMFQLRCSSLKVIHIWYC
uniref:Uncharacterized protein n=1 Tax=Arundo donax TaxID=35708 RepID=A0A0A9EIF4_ARUDO